MSKWGEARIDTSKLDDATLEFLGRATFKENRMQGLVPYVFG